jgi:enterochelin esterase-like enzyme
MIATGALERACACVLLVLAAACGGGGGDAAPGPATGQSPTRTTSAIHSAETGITYNYQVYLPPGYAQGMARYPVIYAADGEYRFPVLSAVLEEQRREAILVDVWHMGSARRWVDFTMPGAEAYHRFLTRELIPAVDATYRTDPARRIYSGHSLSGELAMYAFYLERPGQRHFNAILSGDASFWARPDMGFSGPLDESAGAMEQTMFERGPDMPITLVLASSLRGNATRVSAVHERLAGRGFTNLRLRHVQYTQEHLEMDGPSFAEALGFLLEAPAR